jgi:hypothetical protein
LTPQALRRPVNTQETDNLCLIARSSVEPGLLHHCARMLDIAKQEDVIGRRAVRGHVDED